MHISREETLTHSIQAYSETQLKINKTIYDTNLIVSADKIISPWAISTHILDLSNIQPLLNLESEIILIGHHGPRIGTSIDATKALVEAQVGIEIMSIGAACRTFNVLLQEGRKVVVGVIFNKQGL